MPPTPGSAMAPHVFSDVSTPAQDRLRAAMDIVIDLNTPLTKLQQELSLVSRDMDWGSFEKLLQAALRFYGNNNLIGLIKMWENKLETILYTFDRDVRRSRTEKQVLLEYDNDNYNTSMEDLSESLVDEKISQAIDDLAAVSGVVANIAQRAGVFGDAQKDRRHHEFFRAIMRSVARERRDVDALKNMVNEIEKVLQSVITAVSANPDKPSLDTRPSARSLLSATGVQRGDFARPPSLPSVPRQSSRRLSVSESGLIPPPPPLDLLPSASRASKPEFYHTPPERFVQLPLNRKFLDEIGMPASPVGSDDSDASDASDNESYYSSSSDDEFDHTQIYFHEFGEDMPESQPGQLHLRLYDDIPLTAPAPASPPSRARSSASRLPPYRPTPQPMSSTLPPYKPPPSHYQTIPDVFGAEAGLWPSQ